MTATETLEEEFVIGTDRVIIYFGLDRHISRLPLGRHVGRGAMLERESAQGQFMYRRYERTRGQRGPRVSSIAVETKSEYCSGREVTEQCSRSGKVISGEKDARH